MSASPEAAGTIYDIGYRRYTGPRLGRRAAMGAIVGAGLRSVFGLGRSGRAKVIPWGSVILAAVPAGVVVAVRVLAGALGEAVEFTTYDSYLWDTGALLLIFVAAQAPELVVNDMRHRVMPLYFSRPIGRADYVIAKLAALGIGLLALTLLPVLFLFVGIVIADDDLGTALGGEIGALPGIIGSGLLHAVVLASLGLAISSLAGRRAYAAGSVLAVYLVGGVVGGILGEIGPTTADFAPLASPLSVLDGTRQWLFGGVVAGSPVALSDLPLALYGAATIALVVVSWGVLWIRYRSVPA